MHGTPLFPIRFVDEMRVIATFLRQDLAPMLVYSVYTANRDTLSTNVHDWKQQQTHTEQIKTVH